MANFNPQAYIVARARQLGLDPRAVVGIEHHEGYGGGVGDNGTSFGPFQLHEGGALPKNVPLGQAQQWAWSKQGIDYALRGMVNAGAGGLTGQAAVEAISRNFERPANPAAEISDAMHWYGKGMNGPGPKISASSVGSSVLGGGTNTLPGAQQALAAMMLAQSSQTAQGQYDPQSLLGMAMLRQQLGAAQQVYGQTPTSAQPQAGTATSPLKGGVPFIGDTQGVNGGFLSKVSAAAGAAGATKIRITSGYRSPEHNAAVGGASHSNHTLGHALDGDAFIPGKGWVPLGVALQPVVGKYGLRSGNVPGFFNGGPDPVHVDDGFNLTH